MLNTNGNGKALEAIEVKSRIISKIDSELTHYEEEKKTFDPVRDNRDRSYEILGAIHALNRLRKQVDSIDTNDYSVLMKLKVKETPVIKRPASFLNRVLLEIEYTLEDKMIDGSAGSGANPDAVPGRKEACSKIEEFVLDLNHELNNVEIKRIMNDVLQELSTPELTLKLSERFSDENNFQIYVESPDEVSEEETMRQFQDLTFMDKMFSAFKTEYSDAHIVQIDGKDAIRIPAWEKSIIIPNIE